MTTESASAREKSYLKNQSKEISYQVIHFTIERCRIRVPRLANSDYAGKLNWLVKSLYFVTDVRINPAASSIVVNYESSVVSSAEVLRHLFAAIQQANTISAPEAIAATEFSSEVKWERIALPVLSLVLALLAELLALSIPPILIGAAIAAAAVPFLSKVFDAVFKEHQLDGEILDALWIGFNTARGDFVASALLLSLIELGKALRDTTARTPQALLHAPEVYAWVERDGQEQKLPLNQVHLGDKVIVYPGDVIPVSGRVVRGTALVDEHKLTGESTLVCRCEGQVVHASTLVVEGKLCVLVKRTIYNTRAAAAVQLVQAAPIHDTRVENYAAKVASAAIVPTICLSGTIFALTGDANRALAPLQLDFSNGIGIAVSTTILTALNYAARNGVYIRCGRALEVLARVDTVIFDKTGTLTQGNAAVVAIRAADERISVGEVLTLAASAERDNTHPVASAIGRYAKENGIQTRKCETWDYWIGLGVAAQIDGQKILVGSRRLMQQEGVELEPFECRCPELYSSCYSLVYVAREGELVGVILYADPIRPEIPQAIATLRAEGMNIYMLTGDCQRVANDVARKLDIDLSNTYGSVIPKKKIEVVCGLRNHGRTVAFVGEGINDAAALAYADVSISFAGGCDLARETADVLLLDHDLRSLTYAIDIARRAMAIVYINTAIAVIPNIGIVIAGIVFALDPTLEAIVSNGSAIVAELNSFQPLFFHPRKASNTDVAVAKST